MTELPAEFIERMKKILGVEFESFLQSYTRPPEKGIRVNLLKISMENFEKISPIALDGKVLWDDSGYYAKGESLGKTIAHAAGLYYVQEPSAMCAAPELEAKSGERVLDLCSAPGGKGTRLAAYMHGGGVLVLNEIDAKRCEILRSNVERTGVKNAVTLNRSPQNLAEIFYNYFDKILVDAPCSGEGMFKKEQNAIPEWSMANVARCAARQTEILNCADKMLAGGGRLVYSTCTFAPEEDEEQIESFLQAHAEYKLLKMQKLYPHKVRGEGHFCAVLEKTVGERREVCSLKFKADKTAEKLYTEFEKEYLNTSFGNLHLFGDKLYSLLTDLPEIMRSGVFLGEIKNGRFQPSHTLAMCLKKDEAKCIEIDENTALKYLRGLTFDCNADEKGWRLVTYLGYPLGWCKAVGGVAKNHLPKGLRI